MLEGTVKAVADFGAFVDLGGFDGLVYITDLSWGCIAHPSEVIRLDQVVTVVVLDYDREEVFYANAPLVSIGEIKATSYTAD